MSQALEEEAAYVAAANKRAIVRATIRYTPDEVVGALQSAGLVSEPQDRAAAAARLLRADLTWATFLGADGSPVDLSKIDPARVRAAIEPLSKRYPGGKRLLSAPTFERARQSAPSLAAPVPARSPGASSLGDLPAAATPRPVAPAEHPAAEPAKPRYAHISVPSANVRHFKLQPSGADRLRITVPEGMSVGGEDVSGATMYAPCGDRALAALRDRKPCVVALRADRAVTLRERDGRSVKADPWELAVAFKNWNKSLAPRAQEEPMAQRPGRRMR